MATLPSSSADGTQGSNWTDVGEIPKVSPDSLESKNRAINSIDQAYSVCETMVSDSRNLIKNSARITSRINGERPYNPKKLKDAKKDWKTNISTGFLATECARVVPRFYMPIKTARYLTAAQLPASWPNGAEKSQHFREVITKAIKSWPKFNFYTRGLAREVSVFGFGFNVFFDEYEWRPTLMRMDRGFVPRGTEIMEEPAFFMAKYDYKPSEILGLLKGSIDAERDEWKKEAVVSAINHSGPPPVNATYPQLRSYEELIRQATWGYSYSKGSNLIQTYHLFAKETDGMVSHYILLANESASSNNRQPAANDQLRLLYESLDKYESMEDAMNTIVFDYGDGTIHGSWGVGQILYDLAVQVEKVRCDAIDNLRNTNKMKLTVPDAKNIADVQLSVNDTMMIVAGATFNGNQAALPSDVEGYELLDAKLSRIAQEKIGAFVPPIPLQPSDIKAAQVNAALMKEREIQEALLENWLIQFAVLVRAMTKRLCMVDSPDPVAIATRETLLQKLTEEEIAMLSQGPVVQSVMQFTEYDTQKKAMFAQGVMNNPLFRQAVAARFMANGAGDESFVDEIVVPEGDQSAQLEASSKQKMENAAMALGQPMPVLPQDNDWVHMQTMKPSLQLMIEQGNFNVAKIGLDHYSAHYIQGVEKKGIPKEQINIEKSWISQAAKAVEELGKGEQIKQARAQAETQADAQAQEILAAQQGQIQ